MQMKGTLIVGYGTRDGNLEQIMETQAARLRARGRKNVYIAYFRVSKPSIEEAIAQMEKDGIDDVLVVPYYIAEGKLTRDFIPTKLGIAPKNSGIAPNGMKIRMAPAFGYIGTLTDILTDRIAEAKGTFDSGILVVGHGTLDPLSNNPDIIATNAARLRAIGYKYARHTFNEFNGPAIAPTIKEMVEAGAREIIVTPLFVALGIHLCEEIPEQIGIPARASSGEITVDGITVPVKYMGPVADDPRLVDIIDVKIKEFYGE